MDFDVQVKLAVYRHFAETGRAPSPDDVAGRAGSDAAQVLRAYQRLRAQRLLVLEADGASIRMAPPFSGVPTPHSVEAGGHEYYLLTQSYGRCMIPVETMFASSANVNL
jgi:hypothetical protein